MVMTDSLPPSDRLEASEPAPQKLVLVLFRPVLFAFAAIGLTIGLLVVLHRGDPTVATAPPPQPAEVVSPAPISLAEPQPPPHLAAGDFQGVQMNGAEHAGPTQQDDAAARRTHGYQPTVRQERDHTT